MFNARKNAQKKVITMKSGIKKYVVRNGMGKELTFQKKKWN
jgi:hypothetical protein